MQNTARGGGAAAMAAAMTSGGGSLPAGNGNFCRRHPSLSCLGPSVPRRPPSLSLRTISSKLKETSSEATPRVKNSPQHCSPGATALLRRFLFLVAPPANRPKTDRPTRIPMSSSYFSSSAPPTLTRVRRQRKHFLVQVLTAAASRQRRAGGEEGEEEREEAHCKFKAWNICSIR